MSETERPADEVPEKQADQAEPGEPGEQGGAAEGPDPEEERRVRASRLLMIYVLAAVALLLFLFTSTAEGLRGIYTLRYDQFLQVVEERPEVITVVSVGKSEIAGVFSEAQTLPIAVGPGKYQDKQVKRFRVTRLPDTEAKIAALLADKGVPFVGEADSSGTWYVLMFVLTTLITIGAIYFILRAVSPNRQVMSFGKSKAKVYAEKETKITFDQVAGIDEAKDELREIVGFLKDPSPYKRLGARIPRGILLVGPPGTGKTLLARAVAGEASVVFFSLSGSDFVEMFAGVGASRVRDLFEQATKQAPCIVFIDELDALGKVRSAGVGGAHDEREQTLNQLLAEMDGFEADKGVVILAATNRPEILDPALLRPGRFDRQVVVDRPDVKGRAAILQIHAQKVKVGDDVDLERIAQRTPGLAGADLANIVNEAALLAGRRGLDAVGQDEFEEAIERSLVGLERKGRIMSPREKERVAVHEVGHALVAISLANTDPVARVSIIARGVGALGYTMQLPEEERHVITRDELEDRIAVMLGGRGAELRTYGDTSTGASDDLMRATELARRMVREFGMSERVGPLSHAPRRQQSFLGQEMGGRPDYSDETARVVDEEVTEIVRRAEERVEQLLTERHEALLGISRQLVRQEVIQGDELDTLARDFGAPRVPRAQPTFRLFPAGEEPAPEDDAAGTKAEGNGAGQGSDGPEAAKAASTSSEAGPSLG